MYAVCKNGRCAQTYLLEDIIKGREEKVFLADIKITNGYKCGKCGSVVVEKDGKALLSQNPDVRTFITVEDMEKQEKKEIKEAKKNFKKAKKALKEAKKKMSY